MSNPYRIRQARELAKLTQKELADTIGLNQSAIAQFESARVEPSLPVLEAIAEAVAVPVTFFDRPTPPQFPFGSLLFRKHSKLSASERDQAYRYAEIEYELAVLLAQKVRVKPVFNLPQLSNELRELRSGESFIREAANLTRNILGLSPDSPIPHLTRMIEHSGAIVLMLPQKIDKCDAFSQWASIDGGPVTSKTSRPFIVLSNGVPGDRLRFTLAHELGHLILHQNVNGISSVVEDEANEFAGEFLLPERAIRQQIIAPVTLTSLSELKPVWGVSLLFLIQRAHALKIITERQRYYLIMQMNTEKWRLEEPAPIPVEKARALRQMTELVYGNPINYQKLGQDIGLSPFDVKRMIGAYAVKGEYTKPDERFITEEPSLPKPKPVKNLRLEL